MAKENYPCCKHCSKPCKWKGKGHAGNCHVCQPREANK